MSRTPRFAAVAAALALAVGVLAGCPGQVVQQQMCGGCECGGACVGDDEPPPSPPDASDVHEVDVATPRPIDPLCATCPGGGLPDAPAPASACGIAPDGGRYDPDAGLGGALVACHVAPGSTVNTTCTPSGPGRDGQSCSTGSDCAAGFECTAAGTCRHYCCEGDVACGANSFCDIQPVAGAPSTDVPVCMPIDRPGCALLDPQACEPDETCAVIRADGTTGCVAVGSAKAGESCETEHCARDLVCLGFGATLRRCYELCLTESGNGAQCPQNLVCISTLPLFQDPRVGICQ